MYMFHIFNERTFYATMKLKQIQKALQPNDHRQAICRNLNN